MGHHGVLPGGLGRWAVLVLAAGLALTACQDGSSDGAAAATTTHSTSTSAAPTTSAPPTTPAAPPPPPPPPPTPRPPPTTPAGAPVHVHIFEGDGETYGVGMPIIVYFSKK